MHDVTPPAEWPGLFALPAERPPLIGRNTELEAMDRLAAEGVRLITLCGPTGIGKTQLAIEWAARQIAQGENAVFLPVENVQDASIVETMIGSVGSVDGWPDLPIARLPETLATLLIIDGADHVAQLEQTLHALLNRCPRVRVVVTRRNAPANSDRSAIVLDLLNQTDSVQVLNGNPLAHELVAAAFAEGESREFREASLSDIVAWAIDQRSPSARDVLLRLSVIPGTFSEETIRFSVVAAGLPAEQSESVTRELSDARLLRGSEWMGYRIPVAIREVALELAHRTNTLPRWRVDYARFAPHAATATLELLTGSEPEHGQRLFALDAPLMHLALNVCFEQRHYALARKLLLSLWPGWVLSGQWRLGAGILERTLQETSGLDPDGAEQGLAFGAGLFALMEGNDALAQPRLVAASRPGGPRAQERWRIAGLGALGIYRANLGESDGAVALCELFLVQQRTRARTGTDVFPPLRAMVQLALSRAHGQLGNWADAATHAEIAYDRAAKVSDRLMQSAARVNQAAIALTQGETQTALNALDESVHLLIESPHAGLLAASMNGLAQIALGLGLQELARNLLEGAQSVAPAGRPLPRFVIPIDPPVVPSAPPSRRGAVTLPSIDPLRALEASQAAIASIETEIQPVEQPRSRKGVGALTRREIEVICLVKEDKTDAAIADILFISRRTVEDHMSHILSKLGVYTRVGAVVRAVLEDWCD